MHPVISVQNKNFSGSTKELAKVLRARQEAWSHLHWQFLGIRQSVWRSLLGIIARRQHTDQKQMGLLKKQYAEWRKAPLLYCCNQVWMKIGGQISWNVTPICETSQICYHERRVGQPCKWPIIPFGSLVEYHPITAKDQSRIHQFGKKVLPGLFLGYALYAGWIWKGDVLVADLEELETVDASEIYSKRLNSKEVIFPKEKGEFIFPIADGRIKLPWRRSRPENIHLDTAATNSRRKSRWFSWRIRRVSSTTSRLVSGCRWSDKWFLVHVRKLHIPTSRWTQSQTLLAKRRIIPYSTEVHWRLQNYSYEFACQARETHRWLLEYRWVKRFVCLLDRFHSIHSIGRKTSRRKDVVRGEINEKTADIQARSFMARTLENNGKECQAEGEAKVVSRKTSTR